MTPAAAQYADPRPDQNVRDHLSGIIQDFITGRGPHFGRKKGPQVRVLAASAASPVVSAVVPFIPKLDTLGFDLRVLLAERGMNDSRDVLISALGRLRADGKMSGDVLRQVAGKAAVQVNESLVLGDHIAWIGAPMPDRWAIQTDLGQTVTRPSAVHLAAMGFEAIRLGSDAWPVESELARHAAMPKPAPRLVEPPAPAPKPVPVPEPEPEVALVEEHIEEDEDDGSVAALARHFARFRGTASDADISETAQQPL